MMRAAFDATMKDPEFVAEVRQRNLTLAPENGEYMERADQADLRDAASRSWSGSQRSSNSTGSIVKSTSFEQDLPSRRRAPLAILARYRRGMVRVNAFLKPLHGWLWSEKAAAARPLTTNEVLREEAEAIHHADLSGVPPEELYRSLNTLNSSALCLSGGGIRSAAFALGVMQALAAHPRKQNGDPVDEPQQSLLAQFHYLSTVSGGGYIGSWLSAWLARADFRTVWSALVGRPAGRGHRACSDRLAALLQQLSHSAARADVCRHLGDRGRLSAQPRAQLARHLARAVRRHPAAQAHGGRADRLLVHESRARARA